MNRPKRLVASLLALAFGGALTAPFANAQSGFVSILFQANALENQAGSPLADHSLVLLLANVGSAPNTTGVGFTTLLPGSLQVSSLLNSTYQVLGAAEIDSSFTSSADVSGATDSLQLGGAMFPNLSTGDQLAIAWFPTLVYGTDTALPAGTVYGLYTVNSSAAWQVPAGNTSNFTVVAPDNLAATFTAIPEPHTYAALLGASAFAAVFAFRRRRAK